MKSIKRLYRRLFIRVILLWQEFVIKYSLYKNYQQNHGLDSELIVTLTSFPPRFESLHYVLKSILQQSVQPDRIILWIAHEDKKELPLSIKELTGLGIDIRFTEDTRSFKKIIPTLEAFPDASYIIVDDDLYYPRNTIARLLKKAEKLPNTVIAGRVHQVECDKKGDLLPYKEWRWDTTDGVNEQNFFTGCGGVFFPQGAFSEEVLNKERYLKLAPNADDIWLNWMLKLNETRISSLDSPFVFWSIPKKNNISLHSKNVGQQGNDAQLVNMVDHYGQVYCKGVVSEK